MKLTNPEMISCFAELSAVYVVKNYACLVQVITWCNISVDVDLKLMHSCHALVVVKVSKLLVKNCLRQQLLLNPVTVLKYYHPASLRIEVVFVFYSCLELVELFL